ncbi:MAG: hypothetical protein HKN40_06845 [Winogradskyella sp.]|uniref:hypothetical protein n=1 Tax=Winogradskyella sp. TaxID=1883156 RepID=UPI00179377BE|nr:hypothetical protein [Winogradskyella sp.]
MKRESLPLKDVTKNGVLNGLFFSITMAGYDYFTDEPFSIMKFVFHFISFGFFMAISFRYKYTKIKEN